MTDPDDPVSIEGLLEHGPWVRVLALSLLHDRDLADDVVQKTWIAAMRNPPRSMGAARAWLRVVVVNLVREAYRAAKAREAVEREAARDEAGPSVDQLAVIAERSERIAAAVRGLPRIYFDVVFLRFYEGLRPREIARLRNLPVETVKTRLRRALQLLRKELDDLGEEHGDTRGAYLAPLLLGLPRVAPSGTAASSARPARAAVLAGAAALCVALVAWLAMSGSGGPGPETRLAAAPQAPADGTGARGPRRHPGDRALPPNDGAAARGPASELPPDSGADPFAEASPTKRAGPQDDLVVRVAGTDGLQKVLVRAVPIFADPTAGARNPVETVCVDGEAAIDASRWRVPGNPLLAVELTPEHPDLIPRAVRIAVRRTGDAFTAGSGVECARAAVVTGRVACPGGSGEGVTVAAVEVDAVNHRSTTVDTTTSGADGTFRLRVWPGTEHFVVAATGDRLPGFARVTAPLGRPADAGTLSLLTGATVAGTVRLADGSAPRGPGAVFVTSVAVPELLLPGPGRSLGLFGDRVLPQSFSVEVGPDGRYAIGGLPPSAHRLFVAGFGMAGDTMDAAAVVALPPASAVDIVVSAVAVDVHAPGVGDGATIEVKSQTPAPVTAIVVTGGRATLLGVSGRTYVLSAPLPDGTKLTGVAAPGADEASRTTVLRAAGDHFSTLRVAVPPELQISTVALTFREAKTGALPALLLDVPLVAGRAEVRVPLEGRYRVEARPGATQASRLTNFTDATADLDLSPEDASQWEFAPAVGGRLRILCRDARGSGLAARCRILRDGVKVAVNFAHRSTTGIGRSTGALSASGVTEVEGALPVGSYVVEATGPDGKPVAKPVVLAPGEETVVEFDFGAR